MGNEIFASSDAVRSSKPLAYAQTYTLPEPLRLEHGGLIEKVDVVYETYGQLNERKDNAVLVCHAISGDSHVSRHNEQDDPGWWDIAGVVGPGKAIDTDKYFVICPNILGGCRGTTGPNSINPTTGRRYGRDFPTITIGDMVNVERKLIAHLGIEQLLAIVGGSMGGHQAMCWAFRYPECVRGVAAVATSPRLTSQALAFDIVGRNAILRDPQFRDGQYYDSGKGPTVGLAIARMIGHITYLSREAMEEKDVDRLRPRDVAMDFEKKFSVGSYLGYQGTKFVERFDANSYISISMAMDLFDLGATPEQLARTLSPSKARWLVLSFTSDWLFPPSQSRGIVDALLANKTPVSYGNIASSCGHDAFFLPDDLPAYGELLAAFLANVSGTPLAAREDEDADPGDHHESTSIFHRHRLDYDKIMDLVPPGSSVLDLGCGTGGLLRRLAGRGPARLVGVELDQNNILECVRRGLDVVQSDINDGLKGFVDGQFDYVILSQTLQTVKDVEAVIRDMVRVGKKCLVSFPNLGYWKLRKMLSETGKAPESAGLLRYKWYNSPNIRFLTIADFTEFCGEKGLCIHRMVALDTEADREINDDPNFNADMAIFVVSA